MRSHDLYEPDTTSGRAKAGRTSGQCAPSLRSGLLQWRRANHRYMRLQLNAMSSSMAAKVHIEACMGLPGWRQRICVFHSIPTFADELTCWFC